MKIKDAVILITGGASGLGLECAKELSNADAKVIIFDKNEESLNLIGLSCGKYCLDITQTKEVGVAIANILSQHSKVDVLINNAGFIYSELLINIMKPDNWGHPVDSFVNCVNQNLTTSFIMGSLIAETMIKKRTKGLIINVSSISARGNSGQSAYAAAKAGVDALTKTWAKELGVHGIRAVSIAPGFFDTPSTQKALNSGLIEEIKKKIPLRRLGIPSEFVHSVRFVIENDYINGVMLELNGGMIL